MTAPADPGLQAERTALSWRRTSMAVAVGSLVGLRVLPPHLGVAGDVVCALGLLWSLDLVLTGRRRYRDADAVLRGPSGTAGAGRPGRDAGTAVARTVALTLLVGVLGLVAVAVVAARG